MFQIDEGIAAVRRYRDWLNDPANVQSLADRILTQKVMNVFRRSLDRPYYHSIDEKRYTGELLNF